MKPIQYAFLEFQYFITAFQYFITRKPHKIFFNITIHSNVGWQTPVELEFPRPDCGPNFGLLSGRLKRTTGGTIGRLVNDSDVSEGPVVMSSCCWFTMTAVLCAALMSSIFT